MAITRSLSNGRKVTDWTDDIVNLPTLSGVVNGMNLFKERGTAATSITFTRDNRDYTLLPANDRRLRDQSAGKKRTYDTFALALPYFNHKDTLTTEDVLEYREWNDPNNQMSVARAQAAAVEDMRIRGDQSKEYMKLSALKGVTVDPSGNTLADMFTEFGESQDSVDFLLGTAGTDVTAKIHAVIRACDANNRSGLSINMPVVLCGNTFFDKLVSHADVEAAYLQYLNAGTQRLRDNLFDFTTSGAIPSFEHRGMIFINYAPSFALPDGTTGTPIGASDGYVIHSQARDLYRGYNGPPNKFSKIGQPGAPMYLYEWMQDRDNGLDFELEMAPLYFMTNPLMSVKVTTSN